MLLGSGDGTLAARVDDATGPGPLWVGLGDLNGDKKLDLAVAHSGGSSVSVLVGKGDGTLGAKANFGTGKGPDWVGVGDLDRDGKLDLVTTNDSPTNTVSVLLGKGDGAFAAKVDYKTPPRVRGAR